MKSQNKRLKALCYLDNDKGRDIEILIPVLYYAERYLDLDIEEAFIFDIDKVRRSKPDLVIIANTIGSRNHHCIAKYAYENGIKVFALISEGNFRLDGTFNYWGYNTDKVIYQQYVCSWSKRTLEYLSAELPHLKDRLVLTGATGFDRYKIYDFETKSSFLKRYKLTQYDKIIGYAGWAFGKLYNPAGLIEIKNTHKENADTRIKWMIKQQKLVESVLREAVEKNPDVLFVLKRHPNEIHPHFTQKDNNEMVNLDSYPNVLYLRNEEDVHTLISISDIWTAFESTTVLEAWMMKEIPTLFINPDPDFKRDVNFRGTVVVNSYENFQMKIDEFYQTGRVSEMFDKERIKYRQEILENVIGFADGLNHIRAGYYLSKTVDGIKNTHPKDVKIKTLFVIRFFLLHIGKYFYKKSVFLKLPRLKKTVWIFERFRLKNFEQTKNKYYSFLDVFHDRYELSEKIKRKKFWLEVLNKP